MEFSFYQERAARTDQIPDDDDRAKLVPLLGLAGEVGTLLSEYKKFLRDGQAHQRLREQVAEDLGDLLWYVASTATKFRLDLSEVAAANLSKVNSRWRPRGSSGRTELFDGDRYHLLDEDSPESEQLPRVIEVAMEETREGDRIRVTMRRDGVRIGDALTDNAPTDDGYRFHDVFHLSYAAVLGWSPIMRKLLNVRRKSKPEIDEVQDGARARIIEELISQLVFQYAREHDFLEGVNAIDYHLLKTIHSLVQDREVGGRQLHEWERAILAGYKTWRRIREDRGGAIRIDLIHRSIEVVSSER